MIQIGSNDLCQLCLQSLIGIGPGSPDDFEANIRAVLEYLRAHLRKCIPSCYHCLAYTLSSYSQFHREPDWSIQALWLVPGSEYFASKISSN